MSEYIIEGNTYCPVCQQKFDRLYLCRTDKPFTAFDVVEGLSVWGAYSIPKWVLCEDNMYVHFVFTTTNEHRLVRMLPRELEAAVRDQQRRYSKSEWFGDYDDDYDDDNDVYDPMYGDEGW